MQGKEQDQRPGQMSPMLKNRGQAREARVWQQQAMRGLVESQGSGCEPEECKHQ